MRRIFWPLAMLALLLQSLPALGQSEIEAAGVLAFTRIQGVTYVLLADHRDSNRGWGTFGGHREKGETPEEAAWREFFEETRCIFRDVPPIDLTLASRVIQGTYVSYVVEVPYVPAQVFSGAEPPRDCRAPEFNERGPWTWIPLDVLRKVLEEGEPEGSFKIPSAYVPPGSSSTLWIASATVIAGSIREGYLAAPDSTQGTGR